MLRLLLHFILLLIAPLYYYLTPILYQGRKGPIKDDGLHCSQPIV
jgi:hypothetical protein